MNIKLIVVFLIILSFGMYLLNDVVLSKKTVKTFKDLEDRERVQIIFNSSDQTKPDTQRINVEVVNTPQSTEQGLSGRSEIGADGMFFIFPVNQVRYFWMKDMQFDIDIVWIANSKVVGISSAVPKPADLTPDNRLETYPSPQGVDMVLELNANDAKKYGINPGDVVQLVE